MLSGIAIFPDQAEGKLLRRMAGILLAGGSYLIVARIGFWLATMDAGVLSAIWPAAGVAAAVFWRLGLSGLVGLFIGAFLANADRLPLSTDTLFAFGPVALAYIMVWLPRRLGTIQSSLDSIPDVVRLFLFAAPLGTAVCSAIESQALLLSGATPSPDFFRGLWVGWLGALRGVIMVAPLMMSLGDPGWRLMNKKDWIELAVLLGLMCIATFFIGDKTRLMTNELIILFFPLILWGALRLPMHATRIANFLACCLFVISANQMSGVAFSGMHDGQLLPFLLSLPILMVGGLLVSASLAERRQSEMRLDMLANHDPLTGLPNRAYLQDFLNLTLARAQRSKGQVSFLFIDLDRFKTINDSEGHEVGDQVLRIVAARLDETLRADDFVARLGGDEFAVVISHPPVERAASRVANKLVSVLSDPFRVGSQSYSISASIGISVYPEDGLDAAALLRQSDLAMYQAKLRRSGFEYFSSEMNLSAHEQLTIETGLRRSLAKEEFGLVYQAKVDTLTGRVCGLEALLRWLPEDKTLAVGPDKFIPVAEETGLIVRVGRLALMMACRQWMEWKAAGLNPPPLAVNLSPKQFNFAGLVGDIESALRNSGMPPNMLELEITESGAMDNPKLTEKILAKLGPMGIQLSIDDFGTGHSNLRMLKRMPIQALKIDKSFIGDMMSGQNDSEIVQGIIRLAHTLKLRLVAEGVETVGQATYLKQLGCDQIQGYFISKPLSHDAISSLFSCKYTF
ncbi:MAG: putative bifunctional diguanylate cyclase/phosphodiesterase [Thiobacillaceae bacterium]